MTTVRGVIGWRRDYTELQGTVSATPISVDGRWLGWGTDVDPWDGDVAPAVAGSLPAALAAELLAVIADTAEGFVLPDGRWRVVATDLGSVTLQENLEWGILEDTTYTGVAGVVTIEPQAIPLGVWTDPCRPVLGDEPSVRHSRAFTASPYDADSYSVIYRGAVATRTIRWTNVEKSRITRVDAEDAAFAAIADRSPDEVGGILEDLVEAGARGAVLRVAIQRRRQFLGVLEDVDLSLRQYAQLVGSSGRRYRVELPLRVTEEDDD